MNQTKPINQEAAKTIKERLGEIARRMYPDSNAGCEGCIASVQYKRNAFIFQSERDFEGKTPDYIETILSLKELENYIV